MAAAAADGKAGGTLVVRGWGSDRPGIALAFVKVAQEHGCQICDISQFLLHGSLMFNFVIQAGAQPSTGLKEAFHACASSLQLQIDISDSHRMQAMVQNGEESRDAVMYLVSSEPIMLSLMHDIDTILTRHGCTIRDIEHRSDNKKENNLEYDKIQIRIACPPRLHLSALLMGDPTEESNQNGNASCQGLQAAAWRHGAQITLRWWNAMNTPHGKSLVVFGLSDVLCPYDVLDKVLLQAGLEPGNSEDETHGQHSADGPLQLKHKVSLLKGVSTEVIGQVIQKLEFTAGARLVCNSLKRMGFRLAILTKTGVKEVADHVRRELGIDYTICQDLEVVDGKFTGNYAGVVGDVKMAKADILRLMAEREGIDYGDVIVVGEPLKGMKASSRQLVLETFGPIIHFNQAKLRDLTIVLYLLGFNGADVASLRRKRMWEDDAEGGSNTGMTHRILQVSSTRSCPGQVKQICSLLQPLAAGAVLDTVRLCSLQDGGSCLGVDLKLPAGKHFSEELVQDFHVKCSQQGFKVLDLHKHALEAVTTASVATGVPRKPKECWDHYFKNRHVVTVVQKPGLESHSLMSLFGLFQRHGINIIKMDRLSSPDHLAAMSFAISLPAGMTAKELRGQLAEASRTCGADIAIQTDDHARWMRRLVVFDMDSTLIQQEVIDELAKIAGVEAEVKKITEAAMNGELNFFESLQARVALLKGHNAEDLFSKVKANLIFTPGAKSLCTALRRLGYKMAVISGGFLPVAKEVQKHLGLHYAFANTLEVDEATGLLTGRTSGPVVTPQRKRALLATIADVEGCELQQTIAVGDGANDIPMLSTSGLGIAFCAKPKVQAVSEFRINQKDLSTILFLIGVSERAACGLLSGAGA